MIIEQRPASSVAVLTDLLDEWADLRTLLARYGLRQDAQERIMLVDDALNRLRVTLTEGD